MIIRDTGSLQEPQGGREQFLRPRAPPDMEDQRGGGRLIRHLAHQPRPYPSSKGDCRPEVGSPLALTGNVKEDQSRVAVMAAVCGSACVGNQPAAVSGRAEQTPPRPSPGPGPGTEGQEPPPPETLGLQARPPPACFSLLGPGALSTGEEWSAILQCSGGAEKASGSPPQASSSAWPHSHPGLAPTPGCPFLKGVGGKGSR